MKNCRQHWVPVISTYRFGADRIIPRGHVNVYLLGAKTTRKYQSLSSSPLARTRRLKTELKFCIAGWLLSNENFVNSSRSSSSSASLDFSIHFVTQHGMISSCHLPVTGTRCRAKEQNMIVPEMKIVKVYTMYLCSVAQSCQFDLHLSPRGPSVWRARDTFSGSGPLFGDSTGGETCRERVSFVNGFDV